jgi:uncharacterized protein (TIRG00374 family)
VTRSRALSTAAAIAVVAVLFAFVLPRLADYGAVWEEMRSLDPEWIAALTAAAIVNVLTFAPPWMAAVPTLGFRHAMVLTQTSTALSSIVPGGDAIGMGVSFAMLRMWGFGAHTVATAVAVTGLWNQLVNVGIPLLSLALLTLEGETNALLQTASLVGLATLAAVLGGLVLAMRGDRQAERVGIAFVRLLRPVARLARRPFTRDLPEAAVRFRRETLGLLRARWHVITLASLVGHLSVYAVLLVALRGVGVGGSEVSWLEALAAWSLVRLLTAVPITPGGLGLVELGLSTTLIAFGGPDAGVVAAVLLYRTLTYLPPIVLGTLLGLGWRRDRPVAPHAP